MEVTKLKIAIFDKQITPCEETKLHTLASGTQRNLRAKDNTKNISLEQFLSHRPTETEMHIPREASSFSL